MAVKINANRYNLVVFSAWAVGLFQVFQMLVQLRLLRTLPISTTQLAAVLVFSPIASLALLSIIIDVFIFPFMGQTKALEVAAILLIPMAIASASIPLALWLGFERDTMVLIGLLFFISIILPTFLRWDKVPLLIRYTATINLVVVSFFATKYLLARSSKAYRVQLSTLGVWGMGGRWS
jgi:hypothetical protein